MLDFTKSFCTEVDVCDASIGVVLTHEDNPLGYVSRAWSQDMRSLQMWKSYMAINLDIA
jgi:hypothetical protein